MSYSPQNSFIKSYLAYVEDSESPRLYHIWAALSGIAATLGRRAYLPFGFNVVYPNIYTLLVGPPATKKSTAINIMTRRVRKSTGVKFAPEDTGGKRQGLITALEGGMKNADEEMNGIISSAEVAAAIDVIMKTEVKIDSRDEHVMFAAASEFGSFIGTKQVEFTRFLGKIWDGEDYDYTLKNEKHILIDPLLSLIGGTTPTDLAECLAPSVIGQGFTSRVILVYANEIYKSVFWPKAPPKKLEIEIDATFHYLFYEFDGEFSVSEAAYNFLKHEYEKGKKIADPRFVHYCDRWQAHSLKVCMLLAACRKSLEISLADVKEAIALLEYTEKYMPDALGEFGMTKTSAAKQKMLEYLQHQKGPVLKLHLFGMMQKDMTRVEFENAISDLINAGKITTVRTEHGAAIVARMKMNGIFQDADLIAELTELAEDDNVNEKLIEDLE